MEKWLWLDGCAHDHNSMTCGFFCTHDGRECRVRTRARNYVRVITDAGFCYGHDRGRRGVVVASVLNRWNCLRSFELPYVSQTKTFDSNINWPLRIVCELIRFVLFRLNSSCETQSGQANQLYAASKVCCAATVSSTDSTSLVPPRVLSITFCLLLNATPNQIELINASKRYTESMNVCSQLKTLTTHNWMATISYGKSTQIFLPFYSDLFFLKKIIFCLHFESPFTNWLQIQYFIYLLFNAKSLLCYSIAHSIANTFFCA